MSSEISEQTEETLRRVLYDVLSNHHTFETDFASFANVTELLAACARATDVAALSIVQSYGGRPSREQLLDLAQRIASFQSGWSGISAEQIAAYLLGVREGKPLQAKDLPPETALRIPFVVAGHLLGEFADPAKHAQWYDYLDELWEQVEDRPS